jgi:hypothetical protein
MPKSRTTSGRKQFANEINAHVLDHLSIRGVFRESRLRRGEKNFRPTTDETHALTRTEPQTLEQFFREGPSRRHLFRFLTRLS